MEMKQKLVIATTIVLILAFPLATAFADDAATYKSTCAMCHGASGNADTPMGKKLGVKALTSPEVQKATDDQLKTTISKGKGKMPSFGAKFSPEQIAGLVKYIRGLK